MKKMRYVLGTILLLLISTACGQTEQNSNPSSMATVDDVLSAQMEAEKNEASSNEENIDSSVDESNDSKEEQEVSSSSAQTDEWVADVDLQDASSTIIYGEIYNMVTAPLLYHGKTVKLTGYYDGHFEVMTNTLYCSIFVMDALACCAQGLEIEFSEDYIYPDDYPIDGDEITIYATFEVYYPDGNMDIPFSHLVDAIVIE